jgi:hypothetical protein
VLKKGVFWRKCFSIMMALMLVLSIHSPFVGAEGQSDSPLHIQSFEAKGGDQSQSTSPVDPEAPLPREGSVDDPSPLLESNLPEAPPTLGEEQSLPVSDMEQSSPPSGMEQSPLATQATGKLVMGNAAMAHIVFSIHTVDAQPTWYDFTTDENGQFTYNLPDGTYQVDGIWKDPKWYSLNQQFTIQNGQLVGSSELVIDVLVEVEPVPTNLKGELWSGSEPLSFVTFSIHTLDGSVWYDTTTSQQGEFVFTLPDGNYQVDGIWLANEGKWYELNQTFQMVGGQLEGATKLMINIAPVSEEGNVTGTLSKGRQALAHTIFSVRHTSGEEIWYDLQTDETGAFYANLPDGTYRIEGVWVEAEAKWYELKMNLTVNGTTFWRLDLETMVSGNVSGLLKKGQESLPNTIFSVRSQDGSAWYDGKSNEFGYFDFHLPDGEYVVEGVWVDSEGKWYELNKSFTVQNHLQLVIDILEQPTLEPNIFGVLKKGTETLGNVTFSLHTNTADQLWYDTTTDDEGKFQFTLPDGEYQIDGIWISTESKWYELNLPFSVVGGQLSDGANQLLINIEANTDSVKGVVTDAQGVIKNAEVSITSLSSHYGQHVSTDNHGSFSIQLEDDEYMITGVATEDGAFTPFEKFFSVTDGQMFVDGVVKDSLSITLPVITVESILYDASNQAVQESHTVAITNTTQSYYHSRTVEGKAKFRLPDGAYTAEYYFTPDSQAPIGKSFTVENGLLFINGEQAEKLELQLHPLTLTGQILDGDVILPHTKIAINNGTAANIHPSVNYVTTTDENGYFHLGLPDGDYFINGVSLNGSMISVGTTFKINDGKLVVNGANEEVLQVRLNPVTVRGEISVEGYSNGRGSIEVVNILDNKHYSAKADANGQFELRIPTGLYKTKAVSHQEVGTILHYQTFAYTSGKLTVGGVVQEKLMVKVGPLAKVKGHVEKSASDSSIVSGIHIRLADQNYSIPANVQRDGSFEFLLQDGQYQVTSVTVNDEYVPFPLPFQVIGGKLQIDSVEQAELLVKILPVSLKGNVIFPNGEAPYDVYIEIKEQTTNATYGSWAIDSFKFRIPDGVYKVSRVYLNNEQQWYEMNVDFSIVDGKLVVNGVEQNEMALRIPAILNAQVSFGYQTTNQFVYFEIIDQTGKKYTKWSNSDGSFSLRLPDGPYRIRHAYPDERKNWVLIEPIHFSLIDGLLYVDGENLPTLTIDVPKVQSITGRVVTENANPANNATIRVALDTSDSGVLPLLTDGNGYFTVPLQDGHFKVVSIIYNDETIRLSTSFEVRGGKVFVDGVEQSQWVVSIPPVNFQATVVNEEGLSQKDEVISIFGNSGDYVHFPITNVNGQISLRLADGNYEIGSLKSQQITESIIYSLKFTIKNGKLIVGGVERTSLTIMIPKVNTVPAYVEMNGEPVTDGSISISLENGNVYKVVQVNNPNGEFTLKLQDGKFKVTRIEKNGYSKAINLLFEVRNGKIFVGEVEQEKLVIK